MGRCWFSSKLKKNENINIMKAFMCDTLLEIPEKQSNVPRQIKTLQFLCKEVICSETYPLVCVQFSYAYSLLLYNKAIWRKKSKIDEYGLIPNDDSVEVLHIFPYFSYAEYSEECKQIEFRTLDYTHMLTNMHNHLITHSYDFCPKEHYYELACTWPDILSRAIVYNKIDIQNAFITERMFSCQIEDFFRSKNWNE